MATKRQIAANRVNARRSTGPRNAEGKARASRNAVTHGLAARAAGVRADLAPVGELEEALAV